MTIIEHVGNAVGILGVIIILVAYYLLNINKVTSTSMKYLFANLIGSAFILFSLFFDWNLPAAIIEVAWMIISVIGIYRAWN